MLDTITHENIEILHIAILFLLLQWKTALVSSVFQGLFHLQSNGMLFVRRPKMSGFVEEMELAPHTVSKHWN